MQPKTPTSKPGLSFFTFLNSVNLFLTVCSAFSRMEQVLIKIRSASSKCCVTPKPFFLQNRSHHFAVSKVHRTAIAFYIKFFSKRIRNQLFWRKSFALPCFIVFFIYCKIQHLSIFFNRRAKITN